MNQRTPHTSARLLFGVSTLLEKKSLDCEAFYAQFQLDSSVENQMDRLIPYELFVRVLSRLAVYLDVQHPALALVDQHFSTINIPMLNLLTSSPCLEVALQNASQYRAYFSEITYWDHFTEGDYLVIKRCSYANLALNDSEHSLFTLAQTAKVVNQIIGPNHIEYVALMQASARRVSEIERFFNCPVLFNQDYDALLLKKPMRYKQNVHFDAGKYSAAYRHLLDLPVAFPRNQLFSESVKQLIFITLTTQHCNIESIGKMMKLHHRTLQNRLAKEHLTFKQLVKEVRNSVAKRMLLQENLSHSQIARLLGYSEASAFTRAFTRAHQMSPRAWRKQQMAK
ncbi:helix-turn-helix domain-containing protein [Photobacterium sp. Hal280]|uniref:helix-turn-helix domain-containing protein n=1 Tax=Photobacterium sp. Hal280 TaxID=3035163 RepID=UPI00301BF2E4